MTLLRWALLPIAAGLAGVGVLAAVGLLLSAPRPSAVGPPPPGAEAVSFTSGPDVTLRGWWLPTPGEARAAVVLLHGLGANRTQMARRAAVLHRQGYAVLLYDSRGHGESTATRITFGAREATDAAAAVAYARARLPGASVGAIGVSLGGAALLLGDTPLPVSGLVVESVYGSIESATAVRLRGVLGPAGAWLAPALLALMPPVLGVQPGHLRPTERIGAAASPILVLTGANDDRPPLAEARVLFERAREPKQFIAFDGAGHVDLERHAPDAYWAAVLPFLAQHLLPSP